MINLETTYLGLKLNNPVVVSSSGLTNSISKIKQMESHGAAAIILKSLFEEQINYEVKSLESSSDYPEAADYIRNYTRAYSVEEYLDLIRAAKKETNIPIIASVNCVSASDWVVFSSKIQEAGADALELNVYFLPNDKNLASEKYEQLYFELVGNVQQYISIPLAVKLGNQFTNPVGMVNRLQSSGVQGVVLFNRFYEPDIDIDNLNLTSAEVFSLPEDLRTSLRWVGIISDKVSNIDIAASTGIHDGKAVIKQLLAGANVTQICSTLYKNGLGQITNIIEELTTWMDAKGFQEIDNFRGKMSYKKIQEPEQYERAQFMKYFASIY